VRKNFTDTFFGSPHTIKTQNSLFKNWLREIDPHKVDEFELKKIVNGWLNHDLKPGTILQLISLLKKYVKYSVGRDLDTIQICRQVRHQIQDYEIKAWTYDEAVKALEFTQHFDPDMYKMMLLTLHTGLRKGEMFELRWRDIDLVSGSIFVRRSKNGRPRKIPMSDRVADIMEKGYIVGRDDELCFERVYVKYRLDRSCKEAGVRRVTWHGLRHTFATILLDARESPKVVSSLLGHARVSTTVNVYWSITDKRASMEALP
jgi:integrase